MATMPSCAINISVPSLPRSIPKRQLHIPVRTKLSEGVFVRNRGNVKVLKTEGLVHKWRLGVSSFPSFLKKRRRKEELIEVIESLDHGAEATPWDRKRVDQMASELEALNPIKEPLKSDLLNGKWELIYTTSTSILKPQWPKFLCPNGKIYKTINADTLRAQNMETWPYFNQGIANLAPRVAVRFDSF